jgi:hypothetical protein
MSVYARQLATWRLRSRNSVQSGGYKKDTEKSKWSGMKTRFNQRSPSGTLADCTHDTIYMMNWMVTSFLRVHLILVEWNLGRLCKGPSSSAALSTRFVAFQGLVSVQRMPTGVWGRKASIWSDHGSYRCPTPNVSPFLPRSRHGRLYCVPTLSVHHGLFLAIGQGRDSAILV